MLIVACMSIVDAFAHAAFLELLSRSAGAGIVPAHLIGFTDKGLLLRKQFFLIPDEKRLGILFFFFFSAGASPVSLS